jgi:hypothetical protein
LLKITIEVSETKNIAVRVVSGNKQTVKTTIDFLMINNKK